MIVIYINKGKAKNLLSLFFVEKYEDLLNICLDNENSFFLFWESLNTDFKVKGIIINKIEKKMKDIKRIHNQLYNSLIKTH